LQQITFLRYLKCAESKWFRLIVVFCLLCAIFVYIIPKSSILPLTILRILFGVPFIFFLPGFALQKVIWPNKNIDSKEINRIEIVATSIGTSICIVSFLGLLLYYIPGGLALQNIVLLLLVVTNIFSFVAAYRQYLAISSTPAIIF
jgi:uncharacterized membrane protein